MSNSPRAIEIPDVVPLFALPKLVLFPAAVIPLHIFEDRYRKMTADVLETHKQIAMALLKPGWEKDYYGKPVVEEVVCVGQILSHERLSDGRYNFLLQGKARARIKREVGDEPYRQAIVELLPEINSLEADLSLARQCLVKLFEREAFAALPGGGQIREMLTSDVPTAIVADLLAFRVLPEDQVELKQSLLAEQDVKNRVWRIVEAIAALRPAWQNIPENAELN